MADSDADGCDVNESFGCLVGAGRHAVIVLEHGEAPLDAVAPPIEFSKGKPSLVGRSPVGQPAPRLALSRYCEYCQSLSLGLPSERSTPADCGHDQVEAKVIRCVPRSDPGSNE